ncbi:MAG: hypothetical protein PWQ45_107 [Thermosipho sp. (in: thermotogales)]|jgi:cell division septum initiation protein DivIVA|nr:hypothetical protein [Thermosipho sp. (in: thermotogales)]
MTVRDLLKKIGVEIEIKDEQNKEITGYIPVERFNEVNEEKKALKEQNEKLEENIKNLQSSSSDSKKLKEQLENVKAETEQLKKDFEKKTKEIKKNALIENNLLKENARYPELLKNLINKELISVDGDEVVGLSEQITKLKKDYADLFGENKPLDSKKTGIGENNNKDISVSREDFNKMGYKERLELKQKNPEVFQKLIQE